MLGTFTYHNPTKLYFGENALEGLKTELPKYGKTVQLICGGGSVKRNGIYDAIVKILHDCGKTVVEDGGVMPNPTADKLREGVRIARENMIFAIGIKVLVLLLAAFGLATLWMAVFADVGVTVLAVLNAMRALSSASKG